MEKESNKVTTAPLTSSVEGAVNGPSDSQINGFKKEPFVSWVHKNFQVNSMVILCCSLVERSYDFRKHFIHMIPPEVGS